MAFCLHIAARGQTGYTYDYWFDNDRSTVQTGSSSTGVWQMEADVSGLSEALHSIHIQVTDEEGVASSPITRYFVKTLVPATAEGRYWFDDDSENISTATGISSIMDVDVSRLSDGFHILHLMVDGGAGAVSQPVAQPFVKVPQTEGVDHLTCLCMIDDQIYKQEDVPAQGGVVSWQFDVSSLPQGFHRMFVQVVTPSGAATNTYQSFFMRETTREEFAQMKCVYAIDGAEFYSEAGTLNNGTFHFDLDVSSLSDGLHRITYMLNNGQGVTTKTQTQFFMKIPLGGNGITEYWYWLNEQGDEQAHKVTLQERQDPFSLITLLPVESQPIRSSLFQFRIEEDKPVVYAKNDIHLRFYDASGRFVDASEQYVDYQTKQEVTDIMPINNGDHKTVQTPGKDEIRWFKFYAEEGDTVAFRTDQAATLQVFSPEGKEIYSASGSTSVVYGGCHTWTDGTYYVALHDVTGSKPNTSLDFTHLAKYDVVSYDIAAVGNGGCSTITFKGNGFRDLYAVDFVNEANDSIHAFSIGHESDGTTSVTADFTDATTGKYTALFHFTEGKKYVYDAVTVEDAVPIELATEVTFPRSFGHVVTYTCKITNSGNMTAYAVPIYTWMKSKTKDGIYNIKYDGLNLPSIFDLAEMDSLTPEEIKTLRVFSDKMSDDHYFLKIWTEDEDNPGDSVYVRSNYFFTNIAPYETKILRLTLSTREVDTYAYFTVPEDWLAVSMSEKMAGKSRRAKDKGYCCIRDNIECAVNAVAVTMDMAAFASWMATIAAPESGVAEIAALFTSVLSCATSVLNAGLKPINTVICNAIDQDHNPLDNIGNSINGFSVIGAITSCFSGSVSLFKEFFELTKTEQFVTDGLLNTMVSFCDISGGGYECSSYVSKQPGCPPPPPGGGNSGGGQSHDPNEIYGYLSDAGSHFMTDSVKKVSYRIEFENDTAFATRSAMVVEIRDTLNRQQFDLSTYAPTGIKIGEKVEYLDGEPNFVKTIDMRPEINGLVEVAGSYDATKGIMNWKFTSLDPMTMEPTNDPMQGFLPVNYDGKSGIGEVTYDIALKVGLKHQTEIPNRASIVFDVNEPIMTPTWTNIIDRIAPVSHVTDIMVKNDSTARVLTDQFDGLSGPWRYDVFVQYGEGSAWWKAAENVPADSIAEVRIYEGINHGFYVVATDSAGNVERKEAIRECTLYNGEVTTAIEETPVNKQHGIRLDGTLLTVSTECGWVQQVNVVNMAGQTVVQKGTMQNGTAIDLSRLPAGAYTVTATGCGEKLSRKILLRTEQ